MFPIQNNHVNIFFWLIRLALSFFHFPKITSLPEQYTEFCLLKHASVYPINFDYNTYIYYSFFIYLLKKY